MNDAGRPQDQGRRHRRKGAPGAETATLLDTYRAAMRAALRQVLHELEGTPQPDGLTGPVPNKPPSTTERAKLWDLGIKLARELALETDLGDDPPADDDDEPARAPRVRRSAFGRDG